MSQLRIRFHASLIVGLAVALAALALSHHGCERANPTTTPNAIDVVADANATVVERTVAQPTRFDANPIVTAAPTTKAVVEVPTPVAEGVLVDNHAWSLFIADPVVDEPDNGFPFGDVYSGLVSIDGAQGVAVPELASDWTVSSDGLRYSFQLREGITFSNGHPVTATDVKWSWERALNPEYAPSHAREVFGAILGAEAMLAGEAQALDGVTVVDEASMAVELAMPQAHFLLNLADPSASVLSRTNFENWGTANWQSMKVRLATGVVTPPETVFDELPVGTGPFRIADIHFSDFVDLEPNPHHWRGAPAVAEVRTANLRNIARRARGTTRITLREFDIYRATRHFYDAQVAGRELTLNGESLSHMTPMAAPSAPDMVWVALNSAVPPLDDVRFRRALLQSAHRPDFRNATVRVQGLPPQHADALLPPGFPGGGTYSVSLAPDRTAAETSLSRSRYAGDASGPSPYAHIELLDDDSLHYRRFYWDFTQNWKEWLGIRVDDLTVPGLSQDEYEALMTSRGGSFPPAPVAEFKRRLEAGTLQVRYVRVQPRYPDPCAILCRIPDLFGPNAQSDETRELRAMLDDAAATADRAARIAKYQAIEDHTLDRALVIPVFWDDGTVYRLVKPYISGYKVPAYGGSMYEDVVVDTTHPDYPPERLVEGGVR